MSPPLSTLADTVCRCCTVSILLCFLFCFLFVFFFNDTATTEIYTLSLHDALLISCSATGRSLRSRERRRRPRACAPDRLRPDRKSTRLNSSHVAISYAVFCLKKKNKDITRPAPYSQTHSPHAHHHDITHNHQ